ncbi:Cgr1 family-domain-containing protein [Syncephalis fuscata]|nr:Cgr1 family-domain-containing protein [Syncephalis fuscata]
MSSTDLLVDASAAKTSLSVSEAMPTLKTRVSGRTWRVVKQPAHRSMMAKSLKTTWSARQAEKTKQMQLKRREDAIKTKTELERQKRNDALRQKRLAKEEKERLEKQQAIYSAKKLDRLRRKQKKKN